MDALGTPSLSQTAAALGTTHQNARQVADALRRKGFLTVTEDPADARVRRLATTGRSHDYWQQRSAADQQQAASWFADLSADEAQLLFDLLSRVELRARRALSPDPGTAGGPPR